MDIRLKSPKTNQGEVSRGLKIKVPSSKLTRLLKTTIRSEDLIISECLAQDFCWSSRRGNRRIASYATVSTTQMTDKKTSQESDIIKASLLILKFSVECYLYSPQMIVDPRLLYCFVKKSSGDTLKILFEKGIFNHCGIKSL